MGKDLRSEAKNMAEQYNGAYERAKDAELQDYTAKNAYITWVNIIREFLSNHPEYIELFPEGIMRDSDIKKLGLVDMEPFNDPDDKQ